MTKPQGIFSKSKFKYFHPRKCIWNCCCELANSYHQFYITLLERRRVMVSRAWLSTWADYIANAALTHILTHWGRGELDAISQTTFLSAFCWMKMFEFRIKFHWSLFPGFQLTINNIPTLVQVMAWCRPGDKPLSEPMMVSSLTHICVTRPQWVNQCIINMAAIRFNQLLWYSLLIRRPAKCLGKVGNGGGSSKNFFVKQCKRNYRLIYREMG